MKNPQSPNNWGYTIDEDPNQGVITDDEEIQKYISKQIDENKKAELKKQAEESAQDTPSFHDGVTFYDDEDVKPVYGGSTQDIQTKDETKTDSTSININDVEEDAFGDLPSREKIKHPIHLNAEKKLGSLAREESAKDIEVNRDERRAFKDSNKYGANYFDPKKQETAEKRADLPFFEDDKDIRSEVRLDSKENYDRVLNRAGERLGRHLKDYYIEGAMDDLAHGEMGINPRGFVANGFRKAESSDIEQNLVDEQKEAFWHDIKTEVVPEQIGEWESNIENLKEAEKEALLRALKRGAFKERTSLEKKEEVRLALPILEYGDGRLQNFMKEYGIDPESQYVQMDSHEGFIGVIEAIKDNDEISKGFRALDWYFDTFRYQEHLEEFFDSMDAYQAQSDRAFRMTLKDYLDYREEVSAWEKQQDEKEKDDIAALAESEEVTQEELFKFLESNLHSESEGEEELFRFEDSNNTREKHTRRKETSWPPKEEKCEKALEEIKKIIKMDPDASYYRGTVFREDSFGNPKEFPYVVVRFGNKDLGLNNVIAIPVCDESKAMFYWRGETGDDKDGWKKYFKDTSIRGRDSSVKKCKCYGYSEKGYLALDAQWGRVWEYLNSPKEKEDEKIA